MSIPQTILNILIALFGALALLFSPGIRRLNQHRHHHGYKGPLPLFSPFRPTETTLSPSAPEIDYPVIVPENVLPCGPITIPSPPVQESDAELARWLSARGPNTILINLGSHISSDGPNAIEIAKALRVVLAKRPDVQVLWKLKRRSGSGQSAAAAAAGDSGGLYGILTTELRDGRVRIVSWLETDPIAILSSGHVGVAVHHGGANSYFEATAAGVPQVVLPVWFDTYEFAARVDYLGVGVWGSKKSAPGVEAGEFSAALLGVLGRGGDGEGMRERARVLGEVSRGKGGRKRAAEVVEGFLGRGDGVAAM